MSKELVVSATRHETRIAILEDDQVVEIFYQREKEYSLAGSIHKGRVTRVLPGMQSAFVDIGLERDAFLYVSDFFEDNEEYDQVVTGVEEKVLKMEKGVAPPELVTPPALEAASGEAVEASAAEPLELASATGDAVVEAKDAESRSLESRTADGRPDRDTGNRGDRDGGRRGRRGRRRRGGRSGTGGLPESKFYSPHREESRRDESKDERKDENAEPESLTTRSERPVESGFAVEEFAVLPGESLAKYSAPEPHEEDIREEQREAPEAAPLALEPPTVVEPAAAEDHAAPAAEPVAEPRAAVEPPPLPAEVLAQAAPPAEPDVEPTLEPPTPVAEEAAEPPAAAAPVETEVESFENQPEEVRESITDSIEAAVDAAEAGEDLDASPAESVSEALEEEASEPSEGEPVIEEDEGPEPARIPTSLTAALREQGSRFPHRLSRRARRKVRGGHPGELRHSTPATAGEEAAPDEVAPESAAAPEAARTVAAPDTRPQRGRGERGERGERRDRGGRSDRGDRGDRGERTERSERPERSASTSIAELLSEGQEIIVQIAKEPIGQKGARITSHIALPGRFLVYMPTVDHVGVSRKIPSDEERQRLKRILQTNRTGMTGGFIVRTAGDGKTEEELRADMHFLYNLWLDIRQKAEKKPAPLLLHHDLDLVQRILRDQLTSSFKTIWVDNEDAFESVLRFVQRFQPALVTRVKLYTRPTPIFDEFNITTELEKALRPKVWLKSGGYIVINQTEALVAIDVNTGKYVGKSNRLEDTIVRVNTDAIKEIVRQIRLRDLGGIIVVDFIDMDERKNRQKVMQALEEAMRVDRAPYKILAFNDFGLVAITRKRVKQSLERTLCTPCPSCEGAGYVKSVQTVIGEILVEAQKMAKVIEGDDVLLRVNPEVAKVLKSNRNDYLQEMEEILSRTVMVKSDPTLHQTKFDLA
jgi:ribonuclease G